MIGLIRHAIGMLYIPLSNQGRWTQVPGTNRKQTECKWSLYGVMNYVFDLVACRSYSLYPEKMQ